MDSGAGAGGTGRGRPAAPARRAQVLTLVASCFGLFMGMLDNTVVNVSLPTMQVDLGASMSGLQWVVDAYVLAFACLVLTGGAVGDRYGRRRAFQAGLALFTGASALCGLSPSLNWLIAARAIQGAGTALMLTNSLSVLVAAFPVQRERAQAIGLWAGVSAMALGIGPVLGGVLTETLGWESVFFVNVPVGLVALAISRLFITESRNPAARSLDPPGQALAITTLGSLTFALIEGDRLGWRSPLILGLFTIAAAGLGTFVAVERRRPEPLLDPAWFRHRRFAGANLIGILNGFALFGFLFFNGLYFQQVLGYGPAQAGLRTLPNTLAVVVGAPIAGRLAGRFGSRPPVVGGTLLGGVSLLLLTRIGVATPYSALAWNLALLGIGLAMINSPIVAAAQSSLPGDRAGIAAGMLNTSRQTGAVLGIAVLGAVVSGVGHGTTAGFVTGLRAGYVLAALALFTATAAAVVLLRPDPELAGAAPATRDEPGDDLSGTAA
jgi:DHA2 family methylenomycin A resistance protein-like MFS transporter